MRRSVIGLLGSITLLVALTTPAAASGCVPARSALSGSYYMRATQNAQSGVVYSEFKTTMGIASPQAANYPYVYSGTVSFFLISMLDTVHTGSHAGAQFGLVNYPDGTHKIYHRIVSARGVDLDNGTTPLIGSLPQVFYIDFASSTLTWNLHTSGGQLISRSDSGVSISPTQTWMEDTTNNQASQTWGEEFNQDYDFGVRDSIYTTQFGSASWNLPANYWVRTPSTATWFLLVASGGGLYIFGDANANCH